MKSKTTMWIVGVIIIVLLFYISYSMSIIMQEQITEARETEKEVGFVTGIKSISSSGTFSTVNCVVEVNNKDYTFTGDLCDVNEGDLIKHNNVFGYFYDKGDEE